MMKEKSSSFDWDRHAETWRELDGADDGKRFQNRGSRERTYGRDE